MQAEKPIIDPETELPNPHDMLLSAAYAHQQQKPHPAHHVGKIVGVLLGIVILALIAFLCSQ
jgi:hypothetical protein